MSGKIAIQVHGKNKQISTTNNYSSYMFYMHFQNLFYD